MTEARSNNSKEWKTVVKAYTHTKWKRNVQALNLKKKKKEAKNKSDKGKNREKNHHHSSLASALVENLPEQISGSCLPPMLL